MRAREGIAGGAPDGVDCERERTRGNQTGCRWQSGPILFSLSRSTVGRCFGFSFVHAQVLHLRRENLGIPLNSCCDVGDVMCRHSVTALICKSTSTLVFLSFSLFEWVLALH